MDGSQKIPQRILSTGEDNLKANGGISLICEVIAAWIRFNTGEDELGNAHEVDDPKSNQFFEINATAINSSDLIDLYLNIDDIFSNELRENGVFRRKLEKAYIRQKANGTIQSLKEAIE